MRSPRATRVCSSPARLTPIAPVHAICLHRAAPDCVQAYAGDLCNRLRTYTGHFLFLLDLDVNDRTVLREFPAMWPTRRPVMPLRRRERGKDGRGGASS